MIEVVGWEKHIDGKITVEREEELAYQRKKIILEIISNVLKCVVAALVLGFCADDSLVFPSLSLQ
jgi:hypothetical protein